MAGSTILLILLSALLVGLVIRRLTGKTKEFTSGSGTYTIPERVATPTDLAMLGLSQQLEQDLYDEKPSGEDTKPSDEECPYCKDPNYYGSGEENERPPVDVPRKAKPRKKKASKKKAAKKKSKKSPKRKK